MLRKSKKLLNMPVISLEDGQQLGRVRGLVVDTQNLEIAALTVHQRGWFSETRAIPFNRVRNVGEHAITVDKSSCVERASQMPQIAGLIKQAVLLVGARVITEDGTVLGTVEEFIFEPSGKIHSLEIAGTFLENLVKGRASLTCSAVSTVGKEAVIVHAGVKEQLVRAGNALQDSVKTARDTGSKVLDTGSKVLDTGTKFLDQTVQATRKLGQTISKSVEGLLSDEQKRSASHPNGDDGVADSSQIPTELLTPGDIQPLETHSEEQKTPS
ncbi:MAG: PRC-barrel domain-containing protein [Bacillota bacterium]